MSFRFPERWWAALLLIPPFAMAGAWHRDAGVAPAMAATVARADAPAAPAAGAAPLRVCADPNNLPFSNRQEQGFENRIARVIAADLGRPLQYTWWPQQRGHIRKSLKAGACDLIPGIASSVDMVLTTRPYYRSTYVFVQRASARHRVRSFDDPALRRLSIGVQLIGDDYTNTPPAHALGRRGIVGNVRGYSVYGDYASPNPPARIMDAVTSGEVDVAVVWGPLAGWFARRSKGPLVLTPVSPQVDLPFLPFVFDISMGVRRDDPATRAALEGALVRERDAIGRILDEYGIPRVGAGAPSGGER